MSSGQPEDENVTEGDAIPFDKTILTREIPDIITVGDKYGPAMQITEKEDAIKYFTLLVDHCMRTGKKTEQEAIELEKGNLGYYAGYHDNETRLRVEQLFDCAHPIYGKAVEVPISMEEAFRQTVEYWKKKRAKEDLTSSEEDAK